MSSTSAAGLARSPPRLLHDVAVANPPSDVRDHKLTRPDGRVVAWTECGALNGVPLLRVPGTPGCRFSIRADRSPWEQRGLRVLTTERPGFGASTPLQGRSFAEPADDLAAILDHLGLDAVHVVGGSGSAPHQLAFAARHPRRVRAMTIVVGIAPMVDEEAGRLIGANATVYRLVRAGDVEGLRLFLDEMRAALLADPIGAFRAIMDKAPEADREVMADPLWQKAHSVGTREALRQGVQGWTDEAIAIIGRWDDVDVDAVTTSVTWWHSPADANAPLTAARRLIDRLRDARVVLFGDHEGHLAPYHREGGILDELLARG
jgi:pimeloyl-ACP methyl ester carboxylesterase